MTSRPQLNLILAALVSAAACLPSSVGAQSDNSGAGGSPALPATAQSSDQPAASPTDSIQPSLGPLGDPGGIRGTLSDAGVVYSLTYIAEVLGNASGGLRRGTIYKGRLDGELDIDLGKAAGLDGASLHANVYGIHGQGLSRYYLGNLQVASGIEALSAMRLYELWVEQRFLDGKVALRGGQLAADTEFVVSQYGTLFVNATFGFPTILAADLPNGGPAYPLATPGLRLKVEPAPNLTALIGIFDGAPSGRGPGDPEVDNRNGIAFRLRDPALVMGEVAYTYGDASGPGPLPGTVKLGGFVHRGRFDDLRPGPGGSPFLRRYRGNAGIYAIIDQALFREPGAEDQGLGFFARVAGAPGDRNLVSFYADGGFTYKGPLPGRPNDTVGIGFGYTRISAAALDSDRDAALGSPDTFTPVRSSEGLIELTYQAAIEPGWTVQPDFQYVVRPGAGILDPRSRGTASARSAAVFGLRTTIRY